MSDNITTKYRDITITYKESNDCWMCDLFTKPAESLESAKKRIDSHLDRVKKKPFNRFAAYAKKYGEWKTVDVTSIAEDGKSAQVTAGKERMKIDWQYSSQPEIYPVNGKNTAWFNAITANKKAIERLQNEIYEAESKMTPWTPEP